MLPVPHPWGKYFSEKHDAKETQQQLHDVIIMHAVSVQKYLLPFKLIV
jgi:hypothetical protein